METAIKELDARMGWTEDERTLAWRIETLLRAGYGRRAAIELAERADVDLHAAARLLERGCPVATALRILL